jgi:hypothetical protein
MREFSFSLFLLEAADVAGIVGIPLQGQANEPSASEWKRLLAFEMVNGLRDL